MLRIENVAVKILFIIPHDVVAQFSIPRKLVGDGWENIADFVEVSSVDNLESIFERLEFIDSPVEFNDSA